MATTLIFGGSGKVARHIARILRSQQPASTVYSVIRNDSQSESLRELGATPVVQSIEDSSVSDLTSLLQRCGPPEVVVWSAGAGGKGGAERTDAVDRQGAIKSMDACAQAGVKRFIVVSAIDVRDRESKDVPDWYNAEDVKMSDRAWGAIGAYMKAKLAADVELRKGNEKRKLEYTILRPGGLSDEKGTGKISAGKVHLTGSISREDVARTVVEIIKNPGTIGLAFDVLQGDVPITEAVKKVADEKVDTFEGYY